MNVMPAKKRRGVTLEDVRTIFGRLRKVNPVEEKIRVVYARWRLGRIGSVEAMDQIEIILKG